MESESVQRLEPLLSRLRGTFTQVRVILFGSRSRDDYTEDSDYDLLVVSPSFEGVKFHERLVRASKLRGKDLSVDMICLTPDELASRASEISVVGIAVREGVEIRA